MLLDLAFCLLILKYNLSIQEFVDITLVIAKLMFYCKDEFGPLHCHIIIVLLISIDECVRTSFKYFFLSSH